MGAKLEKLNTAQDRMLEVYHDLSYESKGDSYKAMLLNDLSKLITELNELRVKLDFHEKSLQSS